MLLEVGTDGQDPNYADRAAVTVEAWVSSMWEGIVRISRDTIRYSAFLLLQRCSKSGYRLEEEGQEAGDGFSSPLSARGSPGRTMCLTAAVQWEVEC